MTLTNTNPPLLPDILAVSVGPGLFENLNHGADVLLQTGVASITKLMTAWTARQWLTEDVDLDDTVTVGPERNGPRLFDGDVLTYRELLYATLVPSDNTAPGVIGRNVGPLIGPGDPLAEFVAEMNNQAGQLGYTDAEFFGTVGSAVMSARQVADLLHRCMGDSVLRTIISTQQHDLEVVGGPNPRTIAVTHTIIAFAPNPIPRYVGGKTGTFGGRGHVAVMWEHPVDLTEHISVILNADSSPSTQRYDELDKVMETVISPSPPPPSGPEQVTLPTGVVSPVVEWKSFDLITGQLIADLPEAKGEISRIIGEATSTSISIPMPRAGIVALRSVILQSTVPGRTLLVAVVNEEPAWGGMVLTRDGGTDANLTVGCATLESYLTRRFVRDHLWVQEDESSVIARGLADDAQDLPDVGPGVGFEIDSPPTGVLRDSEYLATDRSSVYQELQALMKLENGLEWTVEYLWGDASRTWIRKLLLIRKRIGISASTPSAIFEVNTESVFESAAANEATYSFGEDYSEGFGANYVVAYSSGEGEDQPESSPSISQESLDRGYPVFERYFQPEQSVVDPAVLKSYADRDLVLRQNGARTWEINSRWNVYPRLNIDWRLGDDISWVLTGHRNPNGVSGTGRCIGWTLDQDTGLVTPILLDPMSGG